MVPYHSLTNTRPPTTASAMLSNVPIRKYSANFAFNSGNLAIDFPVRINPTMEGDCTRIAVTTRNRSSQPISTGEHHGDVHNSGFENSLSGCGGPTELLSQTGPVRPSHELREQQNGTDVQNLINNKDGRGICQPPLTQQCLF